ncbi:CDP-alcohol phosphatidyltransferase family protein [Candidatus Methylacidithermus pantelleriae]|uniref:CDP-diacylglycerol--glycerol-3-phosphate 3-phosphatidyltransferase n=1 Tax=Candidatus Methylacidithermus pantelleriae TaxID=2744239 RepID=A0A8J2FNH0_9BACT|nr:CDP-alcohol phosphatidyltransferase family protein [Candidatus Methylacidithermus pantelleriae]CAF0695948.1 CDP-diacylglycerol--glycerol-3-phosphate 3-phosphatidyltransferase [Candidatus Methylacidithermus pantelleriae]
MTLASWFTVGRLILVPVIVSLLWLYGQSLAEGKPEEHFRWSSFALFLFAAVTDALDGLLARRLRQESPLGKILDPVADKLLIQATLLALALVGRPNARLVPDWFAYLMVARDLCLLWGGFLLWKVLPTFEIRPHWTGKIATFLTLLVIGAAFLGIRGLDLLCGLASLFAVSSLGVYSRYGIRSWIRASYLDPCQLPSQDRRKKTPQKSPP